MMMMRRDKGERVGMRRNGDMEEAQTWGGMMNGNDKGNGTEMAIPPTPSP